MRKQSILFLAIAAVAVILLAAATVRDASACSLIGLGEHLLDADEMLVDTTPPSVPTAQVDIGRNPEENVNGCTGGTSDSCSGTGIIQLAVAAQDDRTAAERMGYQITLASGQLPDGLALPSNPVDAQPDGTLALVFSDHDQDMDFVLAVRAVDLAGNMGEPIEVAIADGGSAGCRVGSSHQAIPLALLGLALLLATRRRNRTDRA